MNLSAQRKIDRILGSFICGILSLFSNRGEIKPTATRTSKILVILLSEMGSLVLARPMFDNIKKIYPHASIYVLLFERNREFLEVLNVIPEKNILCVQGESLLKLLRDSIRALLQMRKNRIDTVLDCELFSRISSIYSFLSGAKIRVGFHPYNQEGLFRGSFINRPVLYNPYHHIAKQFITLVKAIESDEVPKVKRPVEDGDLKVPPLKVTQEEMNELWTRFNGDFPQVSGKKLVLIYPGGGLLPIRAWPLENFCLLTEDLLGKGHVVGIIGMENDRELAETILSQCRNRNCINLTGYTRTVRELMVLFHFASLLITNDGGPGHFASMTPIHSIIFYGPETPTLYGPLDEKAVNFYASLSCSPCLTAYNHRNSPCDGDNVCLKSIDPGQVLATADEILKSQKEGYAGP